MIIVRLLTLILILSAILLFVRFWKKRGEKKEASAGTPAGTQPVPPAKKDKKEKAWWVSWLDLGCAIVSVLIICFFLYRCFPIKFAAILKTIDFQFLILLIAVNVALLRKATAFVISIRILTAALTIAMILVVSADYVRGGPRVKANVRDFFVEPQHQKMIEEVRASHKDILANGIDKEIKQFQEIAKTRPLSEEELKKVDELETNLAKIYSKPGKEGRKGEGKKGEYVFQVKPSEITHTGIFPEKGMVYTFLTDGTCWFVNGSGKNILIKTSHSIRIDTSQNADNPREIQLTGNKTPCQVSIKRVL